MKRFLKYLVGFLKLLVVPKITPQRFSDAVYQYFDFLVSEYGYVFQQQDPFYFIAEKDDIRLNIFLEHGVNPIVTVELLGQTVQQIGNRYRPDVTSIVASLYPEVDTEMELIGDPTDIDGMRKNLKKYATLAQDHCPQILAGDLTQWPEVETFMDEENRRIWERLNKITKK